MPNLRDKPKPGEQWKHFKGTTYEIICIAHNTQTRGYAVVYKNLEGQYFVRPLSEFMAKALWNGKRQWRFEKVEFDPVGPISL